MTQQLTELERLRLQLVAITSCQRVMDELNSAGVAYTTSTQAVCTVRTEICRAEIELRQSLEKRTR